MTIKQKPVQVSPAKRLQRLLIIQGIILLFAIILIAIVVLQAIPYKKKLDKDIIDLNVKKDSLVTLIDSLKIVKQRLDSTITGIDQSSMKQDTLKILPRVYIHIFSNEQRVNAQKISDELSRAGFIVPGVQRIDRSLKVSQVRYFQSQDKTEATKISYLLGKLIKKQPIILHIDGYETKVQPRYFEIWFSPDAFNN